MGVRCKVKTVDARQPLARLPLDKHSNIWTPNVIFYDSVFKRYKRVVAQRTEQQLHSEQESENREIYMSCHVVAYHFDAEPTETRDAQAAPGKEGKAASSPTSSALFVLPFDR